MISYSDLAKSQMVYTEDVRAEVSSDASTGSWYSKGYKPFGALLSEQVRTTVDGFHVDILSAGGARLRHQATRMYWPMGVPADAVEERDKLLQYQVEPVQLTDVLSFEKVSVAFGTSGEPALSKEFVASSRLTRIYLRAGLAVDEPDSKEGEQYAAIENQSAIGEGEDLLDVVRGHLSERINDCLAAFAYRAAADRQRGVLLSDKRGRLTGSFARILVEALQLDPYAAPRFLNALTSDLERTVERGEISAPWGVIRRAPAGLYLIVLVALQTRRPPRAPSKLVGGILVP